MVGIERPGLPERAANLRAAADAQIWWTHARRLLVDVSAAGRRKVAFMESLAGAQWTILTREIHLPQLTVEGIALVGGVIHHVRFVIYIVDFGYVIVAAGKLAIQLCRLGKRMVRVVAI